jgi:2-methylcitrate dehydratase PrpD
VPALLAASHGRRVGGAAFLAAYVAGAKSAIRIGLAAGRSHMDRGWHGTGTFGAAAGAARLFGLTADGVATALGIAAVQAAGLLNAAAGTMCKPLHAGKAAMNGYLAAELAAGGFTSPDAVLERPYGYLTAFSDAPDQGGSRSCRSSATRAARSRTR